MGFGGGREGCVGAAPETRVAATTRRFGVRSPYIIGRDRLYPLSTTSDHLIRPEREPLP